jgi:hypothetical protein
MAPHFLLPTDGKPYFVIKTKQDEYCFTGKVLLHCEGTSATSTKRLCKRFLWYNNKLADVMFETAGKIDRDCELKFTLGGRSGRFPHIQSRIGPCARNGDAII